MDSNYDFEALNSKDAKELESFYSWFPALIAVPFPEVLKL